MKRRITWLAIAAAWIAIIAVAFATLTHVGFVYAIYFRLSPFLMWPAMHTYAHFEHVIAFALLGALFGFAYPRRLVLVCCIVFGAAALLEILLWRGGLSNRGPGIEKTGRELGADVEAFCGISDDDR